MSEHESSICAICGGMTRIAYTIEFRECVPHSISVDPNQVVVPHMRLCPGHPAPVPKHDGKLGKDSKAHINQSGLVVIEEYNEVAYLYPTEALSLLAWLKQEEAELQRMAKEQAQ